MKNKIVLISFFGLFVFFSCKKEQMPEQKVFENLALCCKPDTCNAPVTLRNQTGTLVGYSLDLSGNQIYLTIAPDENPSISDNVLPLFSYYGYLYSICNMPEKLVYSNRERRIKFDCKIFYWRVFKNSDGTVRQTSGYPTQLLRVELLD